MVNERVPLNPLRTALSAPRLEEALVTAAPLLWAKLLTTSSQLHSSDFSAHPLNYGEAGISYSSLLGQHIKALNKYLFNEQIGIIRYQLPHLN